MSAHIPSTSHNESSVDLCDAVRDSLRASSALPSALLEHVGSCELCTAATHAELPVAPWGAQSVPLPSLADERGIRAWLREQPTRSRLLIAIGLAAAVPLFWLLAGRRVDFGVYPVGRLSLDLALLLAPMVLTFPLVFRPLHRRAVPQWVGPALVFSAVAAVAVLVTMPAAHWAHPASQLGVGDDRNARALACFMTGAGSAGPVLVGLWVLSRRGQPLWRLGTLAAVLAGMVGGLSVFIHCPLTSPTHLVLGHATVMLPFVALALLSRSGE